MPVKVGWLVATHQQQVLLINEGENMTAEIV